MKCVYDLIMKILESKVDGSVTPIALSYVRKALPRVGIKWVDGYDLPFLTSTLNETVERVKKTALELWCEDTYKSITESFGIHRHRGPDFEFKATFNEFKPLEGIDTPLWETLKNVLGNKELQNVYGDTNIFEYEKLREFTICLYENNRGETCTLGATKCKKIGHWTFKSSFSNLVRLFNSFGNNGCRYLKEIVSEVNTVGIGDLEKVSMLIQYCSYLADNFRRFDEWNYASHILYFTTRWNPRESNENAIYRAFYLDTVRNKESFITVHCDIEK